MSSQNLKSVDIILLLLYSPGYTNEINEPIAGRTKITKMLFLFEKELAKKFKLNQITGNENIFKFEAWNYGPMSKTIFKDLDFLKNIGFIRNNTDIPNNLLIEEVDEYNHYIEEFADEDDSLTEFKNEVFKLTEKGEQFVQDKNKYKSLTEEQKKYLKEFKTKLNRASLRDILKYVYTTYPDYTSKSLIKKQVLEG